MGKTAKRKKIQKSKSGNKNDFVQRKELAALVKSTKELFTHLKPWLELKASEFSEYGYDSIHVDDLWRYFTEFRWKKAVPSHYYQQIKDIMDTTANQYFDFVALEAQVYKVTSLDDINFKEFF